MHALIFLYFISFLRGMYLHLPIYTVYLLHQGVSASMIVFAAMFYSVGQFVFEVPTGIFADRYGQKISMIIGYVLEAIGLGVILVEPTAIGLSLSYALGGIAAAFLSGSEEALCYENTKALKVSHAKVYGRFMSAQVIGMIFANLVGGIAFAVFGIAASIPLIAGTTFFLLMSAMLTLFLHEAREINKAVQAQESGYWQAIVSGFQFIRSEKLLKTITIVSMLIISGEWFLYNVYQPLFKNVGVPSIWFGLSLSLGMLLNAIVMSNIWRLEKKLKLEVILVGTTLLLAFGYAILALIPFPVASIISVIGILGFVEVYRPVLSDYLNERIPTGERVTILSSISFAQRIASALLRLILTLAVAFGGFNASVLTSSVYLLIGAAVSWWLLKHCGCTHRIKSRCEVMMPEVRG